MMENSQNKTKMAGRVLKFLVKSAVAGSLVYVTLRVTHSPWIAPRGLGQKGYTTSSLHASQEVSSQDMFAETWNKGVKRVFRGLHEAPGGLKKLSEKTFSQLKDSFKNK